MAEQRQKFRKDKLDLEKEFPIWLKQNKYDDIFKHWVQPELFCYRNQVEGIINGFLNNSDFNRLFKFWTKKDFPIFENRIFDVVNNWISLKDFSNLEKYWNLSKDNSVNKKIDIFMEKELMNYFTSIKGYITNGANREMVNFAELAGKYLAKNNLTTTQIRNVYGEIKRIQMTGYDKCEVSFMLLKPKIAYAVVRNSSNKGIVMFQKIFDECFEYIQDKEHYNHFCDLMEAILAYHKANNGRDK